MVKKPKHQGRSLILNADNGEIINKIDNMCYNYPYKGDIVMDLYCREKPFLTRGLNLRTGKTIKIDIKQQL